MTAALLVCNIIFNESMCRAVMHERICDARPSCDATRAHVRLHRFGARGEGGNMIYMLVRGVCVVKYRKSARFLLFCMRASLRAVFINKQYNISRVSACVEPRARNHGK